MDKDELLVGYGLKRCSEAIALGQVRYEQVKAVCFLSSFSLLSDEDFEEWVAWFEQNTDGCAWDSTARRLWTEGKVLQPRMFDRKFSAPDVKWVRWSEFTGGIDGPEKSGDL